MHFTRVKPIMRRVRSYATVAAPVFHLWHPEQDRSGLAENRRHLEVILHSDEVRATLGLGQYL